jgi:membrane associated rhomboid family serine protease
MTLFSFKKVYFIVYILLFVLAGKFSSAFIGQSHLNIPVIFRQQTVRSSFLPYKIGQKIELSKNKICRRFKQLHHRLSSTRRWQNRNDGFRRKSTRKYNNLEIFGINLNASNLIILINGIVYILTKGVPGLEGNSRMLNKLIKVDWLISRGETYRLFTSLLCHGSFYHILVNSMSLYQIGPIAERMFGSFRFTTTYFAAGLIANIGTFYAGSSPYSLGASGCTFGILGALATHYFRNRMILGPMAESGKISQVII